MFSSSLSNVLSKPLPGDVSWPSLATELAGNPASDPQ